MRIRDYFPSLLMTGAVVVMLAACVAPSPPMQTGPVVHGEPGYKTVQFQNVSDQLVWVHTDPNGSKDCKNFTVGMQVGGAATRRITVREGATYLVNFSDNACLAPILASGAVKDLFDGQTVVVP